MTEINEIHTRYIIDPVAFFAALIGGPILFTAATFWVIYIPVIALALGGIPYLLIGTPALLIHLRRNRSDSTDIAWFAVQVFAAAWVLALIGMLIGNPHEPAAVIGVCFGLLFFGTIFSACWGASFGWLYRTLARDFYTRAVTY